MADQLAAPASNLAYGVWIAGRGWLAHPDHPNDPFATFQREVADSACALWGAGAQVLPMDYSLRDLQSVFLEREAARPRKAWWQLWHT